MAVVGSAEITGIGALLSRLKSLSSDSFAKKSMRKALRAGSKPVAAAAKINAPVRKEPYPASRKNRSPGTLRKQIKVRAIKRTRTGVGVMISASGKKGSEPDAFYGAFQEYGTASTPAQGFMRKGFDTQKDAATAIVSRELAKAVVSVAQGARP